MERYAIKEKDSFVFCAANMEMWVKRSRGDTISTNGN